MEEISNYVYMYDIEKNEAEYNCILNPTDVIRTDKGPYWLYARNNKYGDEEDIDDDKVGKWMLFVPKAVVNAVWQKIKNSIKEGHLWNSKVSTSDPENPTFAIMIYTKDYTDVQDVISVLDYLETSGIKPLNITIRYKTDQQTRAGVYSNGGKQKASIYASNTIRQQAT